LAGLATINVVPSGGYNAASAKCPCLLVSRGTTNGSASTGHEVASIVRLLTTPGTGATGTLSGVVDENAGGTITSQGTWPYSDYMVDSIGFGTITGTGPKIYFIAGGNSVNTLDDSMSVMTGSFRPQNSTSIESFGSPYVVGADLGVLGLTPSTISSLGVVTPSGATSGMITGTLDVISSSGSSAGVAASGNYTSIDPTTGRGTGSMSLIGGSAATSVVVYARRHREWLVLDTKSADPFLLGARVQ